MSLHFNAYEQTVIKHEELIARAEIERSLREAAPQGPGVVARICTAIGRLLISAGESLAEVGHAPGRV